MYVVASAYVLITCVAGTELGVIQNLKDLNLVTDVHEILGAYDIIATINSDKNNLADVMKYVRNVVKDIRKIDDIRTTSTLLVTI